LNGGWQCVYAAPGTILDSFLTGAPVPSIFEWTFEPQSDADKIAWLQRAFRIEPVAICVHYLLSVECAPTSAEIYLNGRQVGVYGPGDDPAFELDVTDHVHLEDNTIAFRVERGAVGQFGGLRLRAVPCEEIEN